MTFLFRCAAGFGMRIECSVIGQMLMEELDCYAPLVNDRGADCAEKRMDGIFSEFQIRVGIMKKISAGAKRITRPSNA